MNVSSHSFLINRYYVGSIQIYTAKCGNAGHIVVELQYEYCEGALLKNIWCQSIVFKNSEEKHLWCYQFPNYAIGAGFEGFA